MRGVTVLGSHRRMRLEADTLEAMIRLYCRGEHGSGSDLCTGCAELWEYALSRLTHCPYQESKPTCARCPTHCYRPGRRDSIRAVMRYAGPRMLLRHPLLALLHLADGLRRPPKRHPTNAQQS